MKTKKLVELVSNGGIYLTISLLGEGILLNKWQGAISREDFKKGIDKTEELITVHKPSGCLIDLTNHIGVWPHSPSHAASVILNYIKEHYPEKRPGKKFRIVVLVSREIFIPVSIRDYIMKIGEDAESVLTDSMTIAVDCIKQFMKNKKKVKPSQT